MGNAVSRTCAGPESTPRRKSSVLLPLRSPHQSRGSLSGDLKSVPTVTTPTGAASTDGSVPAATAEDVVTVSKADYEAAMEQLGEIDDIRAKLAQKDTELAQKDTELAEKDAKLAEKDTKLSEANAKIEELQKAVEQKSTECTALESEVSKWSSLAEDKEKEIKRFIDLVAAKEVEKENLSAQLSATQAAKQQLYTEKTTIILNMASINKRLNTAEAERATAEANLQASIQAHAEHIKQIESEYSAKWQEANDVVEAHKAELAQMQSDKAMQEVRSAEADRARQETIGKLEEEVRQLKEQLQQQSTLLEQRKSELQMVHQIAAESKAEPVKQQPTGLLRRHSDVSASAVAALRDAANSTFGLPLHKVESTQVEGYKSPIPVVLQNLLAALSSHDGLDKLGIFRVPANDVSIAKLKRQLSDRSFKSTEDANAVANLITEWFRELPYPILFVIDVSTLGSVSTPEAAWETINAKIPEPERSLFLWLLDLCILVDQHSAQNKMTLKAMAICIAPNILRMPSPAAGPDAMMKAADAAKNSAAFLERCILYRKDHPGLL